MRSRLAILFAAFCSINAFGQTPKAATKKLYFLNSEEQWCGYGSESLWRAEVESLTAQTVAVVNFTGGISSVQVTTEDDPGAGDWAIFDTYSLSKDQRIGALERTVNVLPGDISQLETWRIQNGKATKQKSVSRDLTTLKPRSATADWLPSAPIYTRLGSFPFWPLIRDKQPQLLSKTKVCITVKRPPRKPPAPPRPIKSWKTFSDRFGWTIEYPATWKADSSCPSGCKGESVSFCNPQTEECVLVVSLSDELAGRSVGDRLQQLKKNNVNPQIGETLVSIDNHPALTVRYEQPETQMETTYIVSESAFFEIHFSSSHWKLEQMTDHQTYRHMLLSFKRPK